MVSPALDRLRRHAARQARIYQDFQKKAQQVRQHPYLTDVQRKAELDKLVGNTRQTLEDTALSAQEDAQIVRQRPEKRKVQATPEAVANVRRYLDRGIAFPQLVQLLTDQGDRAGLAALAQEIPFLAAEANGNGLPGREPVKEAQQLLTTYESRLWTDQEKAFAEEIRECDISLPLLLQNDRLVSSTLDKALLSHPPVVEKFYHWQGLPDDAQPKGFFNPLDSGAVAAIAE